MRLREGNVVRKRGGPGHIKVGLVYPSVYEAAIASLSYQAMYYYLNSLSDFVAERFVFEGDRRPIGLEWGSRLSAMDVIMASVHYELDYLNLVKMLISSDIEPDVERRRSGPLLVVGGPPAIANPAPLSKVADLIMVGEMESLLPVLVGRLSGRPRDIVDALASKPGFYTSGLEEVKRVYPRELPLEFHPIAQIQPLNRKPIWGRSLLVEAMRGCFRGCRFCMEGHIFLPKRDRVLIQIEKIVKEGLKTNSVDKVTFYSLSFFDHRDADGILEIVGSSGAAISVPSLRIETLSEERIETIARLGQRTLTLAPESNSCRLKRAMNKYIPENLLVKAVAAASRAGMKNLKLYYMIGLPGETMEEAIGVAREVLSLKRDVFSTGRISVTINQFMPKPSTPMQWMPLEDERTLRAKVKVLMRMLNKVGVEVSYYNPRLAVIQTVLSRGGPEVSCPLLSLASGVESSWMKAMRRCRLDVRRYLMGFEPGEPVPWAQVDLGLSRGLLEHGHQEYLKDLEGCPDRR